MNLVNARDILSKYQSRPDGHMGTVYDKARALVDEQEQIAQWNALPFYKKWWYVILGWMAQPAFWRIPRWLVVGVAIGLIGALVLRGTVFNNKTPDTSAPIINQAGDPSLLVGSGAGANPNLLTAGGGQGDPSLLAGAGSRDAGDPSLLSGDTILATPGGADLLASAQASGGCTISYPGQENAKLAATQYGWIADYDVSGLYNFTATLYVTQCAGGSSTWVGTATDTQFRCLWKAVVETRYAAQLQNYKDGNYNTPVEFNFTASEVQSCK